MIPLVLHERVHILYVLSFLITNRFLQFGYMNESRTKVFTNLLNINALASIKA